MSEARWVEVHRLAVAGGEAGIARGIGSPLGQMWLATSRFADVVRLAEQTLALGDDAAALYQLGWARRCTGRPAEALSALGQALPLFREVGSVPCIRAWAIRFGRWSSSRRRY
jgi:hypothetical protein